MATIRGAEAATRTWDFDGPTLTLDGTTRIGRLVRSAPQIARSRALPAQLPWQPTADDLRRTQRFLDEHAVSATMVEYLDRWTRVAPLLRRTGRRVVAHAHGYDVAAKIASPFWRALYGRAYAGIDIVVPSTHMRRRLVGIGMEEDRIHVVPCGVAIPPPIERDPRTAGVRFLAVGRFVAKKDPVATIKAFTAAAPGLHDARLEMVGDGPLLAAAEREARSSAAAVTLHGAQPHAAVLRLLQECDVFVQHSVRDPDTGDEEGLPVGLLEAMAAGLPVVATRHAGIPDAVLDGTTGLLVDEGDITAMADAMHTLACDPELRASLGEAGRARAASHFSLQAEARSLRTLLRMEPS